VADGVDWVRSWAVIDVRRLRTDLDGTVAALARKKVSSEPVRAAAALDERLRDMAARRDEIRAEVNSISKQVGALRKAGNVDEATALQDRSKQLGDDEKSLDAETTAVSEQLRELLLEIPNIPFDGAPDGLSDADNPVIKEVGDVGAFGEHHKVPHWETAEALGILDVPRATKLSGSMFTMLRKQGATLARALCQYALDSNADAFEEVRPPSLVLTRTLTATGQLPKFADDAYAIERDDLWAIPTAEAPLTSMHADETLAEAELPVRFMAYSPCFRREAGSAGRDTRGMLRTHEFDKVELFAYTTPAQAPDMLMEVRDRAERLISGLGLTYRIIEICVGDLGQSHHRSFDIEVWAPGVNTWLEVSSVSWFSDYQARRANVRYKPTEGKGSELVHTINGSALAVPRVWAAIVETYRQPDGSVQIPDALLGYFRGATHIR
jgi:seryl-tRNA synthetase